MDSDIAPSMARYSDFVPQYDVGLIGGTGIGPRLAELPGSSAVAFPTPFGFVRAREVEHEGIRLICLQRHSSGHKVPPHKVGYRAMAWLLAQVGAKACLATAAVGCLRPEWPVGALAVATDFLDFSGRRLTMFDQTVEHTDFTQPFPMSDTLERAAEQLGIRVHPGATYLCGDGPRYETPAEIKMMGKLGADVVGMTASTEAILMREAGVRYGCLCVVTNAAAGMGDAPLHHGEVTDVMKDRGGEVVDILLGAARLVGMQ